MKSASIFHGTGGTPEHFWFPYLKQQLENRDYAVWLPQLPDTKKPNIGVWLPFAIEGGKYTSDTVLVGHSAGCPLILSLLEKIPTKVALAVLVAGFTEPLDDDPEPILQKEYDWNRIRSHANHFIFINSDNDPWGCDDTAGRKMFDKLGGTLIVRNGEGHMGSDSFNQPYRKFPLLPALIDACTDHDSH